MFISFLVLLVVLALSVRGEIEYMSFKELESDGAVKMVVFHDPAVDESNEILAIAKTISEMPEFNSVYVFRACDVSSPENKAAQDAGLTGGTVFTQTPEGGIDRFGGKLSIETFRSFHQFRSSEVEGDNVQALTNLDDIFALAQTKPVFLKMYEQWCGHCKKMKKHFQYASTAEGSEVHFVEVECSAAGNVCAQFDVKGYPTVRLLSKVGNGYEVFNYDDARTHGALADFAQNAADVTAGKSTPYTGIVPKEYHTEL